tara:strand:+ start:1401 stop:2699 length:1299 start_codon:yes stop_codon:yes gene_type:complete
MIKILFADKKNFLKEFSTILEKRKLFQNQNISEVKRIIKDVKSQKDRAILSYEKKYSKKKIKIKSLKFSKKEIGKTIKKLDKNVKKSIDTAFLRIKRFHIKQKANYFSYKDKFNNELAYKYSPIEKVGIYVPGGTANYPSSVLMNCIPAIVAGVKNVYMTTPCLGKKVNPGVIYAAKKCGVKEIYKIGGAHSIAAFAYGTEHIQKVNKIVGPGNSYVASAKKEVFGDVGIDSVAGPSEVTIFADKFSNPDWVASDLIAQAEHDKFSQSILISDSLKLIEKVKISLKNQIKQLPRRHIAQYSLENYGYLIYAKKRKNILNLINEIAPEHLELSMKNPNKYLKDIKNAGSIFLGYYSAEAFGDYLAGPNHVLPTTGSAKFSSGLSVFDFLKRHSLIKISKRGIESLGPLVISLAQHENLEGHANSVKIRKKKDF